MDGCVEHPCDARLARAATESRGDAADDGEEEAEEEDAED